MFKKIGILLINQNINYFYNKIKKEVQVFELEPLRAKL